LALRTEFLQKVVRSYLKKVFSPGIGVESLSQILGILEYACGLILGLALISNENPNCEIASSLFEVCGVESFSEPAVNILKQLTGLFLLALMAPVTKRTFCD
jgi:hypothetical protein